MADFDFVDGNIPLLNGISTTPSVVQIDQRVPKMEMKVLYNGPALVGEWFHIKVHLRNSETTDVSDVAVHALLEEADDLIIADTTRLTLDYR